VDAFSEGLRQAISDFVPIVERQDRLNVNEPVWFNKEAGNWPASKGSSTISTKRAKMLMISNLLLHIADLQRKPSNK